MDDLDKIRRKITMVLEVLEDACERATVAQLPDFPNETRLHEILSLSRLIDTAKSHCDKAEDHMRKYIRSQSE